MPVSKALLDPIQSDWRSRLGRKIYICEAAKANQDGPVRGDLAMVFYEQSFMLFYQYALYNARSLEYAQKEVKDGQDLDRMMPCLLSVTWILEMGHYARNMDDQDAMTENGKLWKDDGDNVLPVSDTSTAFHLARFQPKMAFESPENHARFAAAMGTPQWFWGTCKARTQPAAKSVIDHHTGVFEYIFE